MDFGCRISLPSLIKVLILRLDISMARPETSQPIKQQPFLIAAMAEDELPKKGSQTVYPSFELAYNIA